MASGRQQIGSPKYDWSMTGSRRAGKVRKTLTLDPEVVAALGDDPAALSTIVNAILLREIQQRAGRAALERFLDRLDEDEGPPDPEQVAHFRRLLS